MHTPGPWIVQHSGTGDARVIATPGWKNKEGSPFTPVIVPRIDWDTAQLISSAPDLLEALKGLLENAPQPKGIKQDFSYILYREAAKKAIAKAEGKDH